MRKIREYIMKKNNINLGFFRYKMIIIVFLICTHILYTCESKFATSLLLRKNEKNNVNNNRRRMYGEENEEKIEDRKNDILEENIKEEEEEIKKIIERNGYEEKIKQILENSMVYHDAYEIIEKEYVEELLLKAITYRHKKTNATVLSIDCGEEDPEMTFTMCFRTPPIDLSGTPHILEHSILSGSKKYPLKDPFAALLKGSLYTFLNAYTYNDMTCYPVASKNEKDLYNMADVYFDAVFHPLLLHDPIIFKKEGWHYEIVDDEDNEEKNKEKEEEKSEEKNKEKVEEKSEEKKKKKRKGRLIVNGVVYNEMKGQEASPKSIARRIFKQALFPVSYPHSSGGYTPAIPELTYEKFINYYKTHYFPSNCLFIFYGHNDAFTQLNFIDKSLKTVEIPVDAKIPEVTPQPAFDEMKVIKEKFSAKEGELKDIVLYSWVLNPQPKCGEEKTFTNEEILELYILDDILNGNAQKILSKALMNSNLGTGYIGSGLNDWDRHFHYSIGLEGVTQEENVDKKVEKIILDKLKEIVNEGISNDYIEAAINTVQFTIKGFAQPGVTAGVNIACRIAKYYFLNREKFVHMRYKKSLESIRKRLSNGEKVFENLIQKYFLENNHRVLLHMQADANFEEQQHLKERQHFQNLYENMTDEEVQDIKDSTLFLKKYQAEGDTPEAVNAVPILELEDIDKKEAKIPSKVIDVDGAKVIINELETRGVLYVCIAYNVNTFDLDDLTYVSIFLAMLTESGTSRLSEIELSNEIGKHTERVSFTFESWLNNNSSSLHNIIPDSHNSSSYIIVKGNSIEEKMDKLMDILYNIITDVNLSNKGKAIELLKSQILSNQMSIRQYGHSFAAKRVGASMNANGYLEESVGGISSFNKLKDLLNEAEVSWCEFEKKLKNIKEKLLRGKATFSILGNKSAIDKFLKEDYVKKFSQIRKDIDHLSSSVWSAQIKSQNLLFPSMLEAHLAQTLVNHVAMGGNMLKPGEKYTGQIYAISRTFSSGYLWKQVRSVGGAYGVYFSLGEEGNFLFFSYLDPNVIRTIQVFKNTAGNLFDELNSITARNITETVIKAIRAIDAPKSFRKICLVALTDYLTKYSYEEKQQFRNEILSTSKEDFVQFAERLSKSLSNINNLSVSAIVSKNGADEIKNYPEEYPFTLYEI